MAKKQEDTSGEIPEWVVTYGDMMSLLLCFFILLSAFSELKKPREYQRVIDSIKESMGLDGGLGLINLSRDPQNSMINHLKEHARLGGDKASRSDVNEQSIAGRDQTVQTIREGAQWALGGPVAFQPASVEIPESAKRELRDLAKKIKGGNERINITGHAWGLEDKGNGDDYRDLSYERAKAVAAYLETECDIRPERLAIVAAGNSEPLSVDRASPDAGAQNRRVEVVVTDITLAEVHPDPEWQGN